MRSILFVLLFILIVATVVLYFAMGMQSQAEWARDLCRYGAPICHQAYFYLLVTATAIIAIYFLLSRLIDF
jgi:heme/copper-type cytochrome/quinol oxidase subunit 2